MAAKCLACNGTLVYIGGLNGLPMMAACRKCGQVRNGERILIRSGAKRGHGAKAYSVPRGRRRYSSKKGR